MNNIMKTKQVIVVRKDLKMPVGKIVAQGSHASLGVFTGMMNVKRKRTLFNLLGLLKKEYTYSFDLSENSSIRTWLNDSFTKICVYVNSEEELMNYYNMALAKSLPACLIEDNGLTVFKGVKTKTCVAIGPAESSLIDEITGNLKLL